jgi:hypoxanthine phosphoribosyltransferase
MLKNGDPALYLQNATLIHSALSVDEAVSAIAKRINEDYVDIKPIVLCVMGGGLVFAGQLLPKLTFPLEFDYVQATRYHGTQANQKLTWVITPKESIKNRDVLILDDILDEGVTLKAIADSCLSLGARTVKTSVLVEKLLGKIKPIHADYLGLTVPNRFVFGCGMDINGWWRNLPAIYALNEGEDSF